MNAHDTQTYVVDDLAHFVVAAERADLTGRAMPTLKRDVLDSIGCSLGALDGELVPALRAHAEQFSSPPTATFGGGGGQASVDQTAFFNAVLVRDAD
jgi:2-methylcitrate dehydratase